MWKEHNGQGGVLGRASREFVYMQGESEVRSAQRGLPSPCSAHSLTHSQLTLNRLQHHKHLATCHMLHSSIKS